MASQDIENKLWYLKEQIVKIWAVLLCLFLWLNMSYTTIFYSDCLCSYHILIFLCVLMVRSLPSATKLPFCVLSLYRGHFLEQLLWISSNGDQIITQISYFCSTCVVFLILKKALSDTLLGQKCWFWLGGAGQPWGTSSQSPIWLCGHRGKSFAEHVKCSLWI